MPKISYKGSTVSDHWVRSPVLNLKAACVSCQNSKHDAKVTEKEPKDRVEQIQDRHWLIREQAMGALMGLIADLKAAKEAGRGDAELKTARYLQRRAQFYLDFVEAENSTGFHAPQEAARILAESINLSRQGQLAARCELPADGAGGHIPPPPAPAPAGQVAGSRSAAARPRTAFRFAIRISRSRLRGVTL